MLEICFKETIKQLFGLIQKVCEMGVFVIGYFFSPRLLKTNKTKKSSTCLLITVT